MVRIGLMAWDIGGSDLVGLARAAEVGGFDAVWLGERTVLPIGYRSRHPASEVTAPIAAPATSDMQLVDSTVALGAVASATSHLRIGTGISILPLRHPIHSALAAATLADLSRGRFMFGIGAGWLEEEFEILDVPFAKRYRRLRESIEIMRAAWAGGPFEYHGECFSFEPCQITRSAVQVPLIMGGNTPKALDRAALLGDGWISSRTPTFDEAVAARQRLLALRETHGLTQPFHCYVRVPAAERTLVSQYEAAGFEDLIVRANQLWPSSGTIEEKTEMFLAATQAVALEQGS